MKLMICSQISCTRLRADQLQINMDPLNNSVQEFITQFMQPYMILAKRDQKRFSLELTNHIPSTICVDWTLYSEILYHLV